MFNSGGIFIRSALAFLASPSPHDHSALALLPSNALLNRLAGRRAELYFASTRSAQLTFSVWTNERQSIQKSMQ